VSRPIVPVVYAEATAPVVRSQTPALLRAWRETGRIVDAAVFTSPRAFLFPGDRAAHESALAAFTDALGRRPWTKTHLPRDLGLRGLGRSLAAALRARGVENPILLCRQPRAALIGCAAREKIVRGGGRATAVLDLRGLRADEYLATLGRAEDDLEPDERARVARYRRQEADACAAADAVLCVSFPMVRVIRNRHGLEESKLGRVWNLATGLRAEDPEVRRAAARKELGVAESTTLFVYSGTMAAWQMPQESALLVQALRQTRPDTRLFVLTPDVAAAKAAISRTGLDGVIYRSAPQAEVPRWLVAADYGLLLRADSMVNRVACPVKFGEYLACGVRPVVSAAIGDLDELLADVDLGVVVGLADASFAARRVVMDAGRPGTLDAHGRARRRAWAAEHLSAQRVAEVMAQFLDGVAG